MPENHPNPIGGAVPPKPAEAAKVQPKKETVRINLPPKPTSSATIKLPTLAPGAPAPAAAAAAPAASAAPAAPRAPAAPTPPPAGAARPAAVAAPAAPRTAAAPAPAPRPVPMAGRLSGLDQGLAIAAAIISLAALGTSVYLGYLLQTQPGTP